ncbi:CcdC family protein [Sediminibacillus albus]|uniref:Membrane protein CcdC involved in cytochrome C biogenesis n=1 Tax=Sediminibacillus albus TaxID=407036 RepID=A0A1G8VX29_9BACI|nr:cytochrome c biogenesis protein CcdC [Sediminibacillus albus]SDJ70377.1 Membrane protein CcdC involved in cytochrome C biogenesis [Sediminibacillus albus]
MLITATTILGVLMAVTMVFIRLKASKRPASKARIILPPLFMSTGAFMFLFPAFQVSWQQVIEAVSVGVIFSLFLIKTSNFEVRNGYIYLIPSKAFVFILFGLLLIRIVLKVLIGQTVSVGETSGMFYLLAFGMILSWRIAMLLKFTKIEKELNGTLTT